MGRGNEVVVLVELDEVGWFAMRPSETAPDMQSGQRRAAAEPTASVERRSMTELGHRRDEDPAFEGTPRESIPVSASALWQSCRARVPRAADLQAVTRLGW